MSFVLPLSSGCGTLSTARPLEPGQHEVGITLGGAIVDIGAPIPIPNAVIEGRSGITEVLDRPLDINYGLNATALAFGILQGHVGMSWLLAPQNKGVPAVSFTERTWWASNALGLPWREDKRATFWGAQQFEVDVSWEISNQILYVGLAQYIDFGVPELALTPVLGATFDPGKEAGLRLHLEMKWWAINQPHVYDGVTWVPDSFGAIGVHMGLSYKL